MRTGIISDLRMLKHQSKKNHPESPQRLTAILKMLEKTGYLTHNRIEYISTYQRYATDEEIGLVYPNKYIEYIKQLWPKVSHRSDITVLDTYFNEHSQQTARLSSGGVLQGIDNIMNGRWRNGFSLIRPPGHHSGAKNTINGFCIFNNIAIGARYLQKKYSKQKVAILDYDIHQGDGTHHIFNKDPNILFISVHRHDHGAYYPAGQGGNYPNCGKEEGEGSKLNIPLNYFTRQKTVLPFQAPGDNEYIYIYNRIIHPIIESFNPDFILVSSGFDASRFDPIGEFTVTPNAYYYMTRRLQQFNKPMLCVLEGGYNLNSTAQAATAVVKALIQQSELPEPLQKISYDDLTHLCHLEKQYHENVDEIIEHHSKYWKVLASEPQIQYSKGIKENKSKVFGIIENQSKPQVQQNPPCLKSQSTNQFYFAAGHMQRFKNLSIQNNRILKWVYPEQLNFYMGDFPEKAFAPKFYGLQGEFASIENVLYKLEEPIVIDVKLSRQSKNPHNNPEKITKELKKEARSTSEKYGFRIGGFATPEYKEGGILINNQSINRKILKKAVTPQNKQFFCDFLRDLASQLKKVKRHYFGTSILLAKGKENSNIKWIDFHYWYESYDTYDSDLVQGIQKLIDFILSIDSILPASPPSP